MHITLETDYAIRIVDTLAKHPGRMGAKAIAEQSCVTLRFSLKILRKLVSSGIIRSFKGAQGGYEIARSPEEISINDILETIEGPLMLNRCVPSNVECTRTGGAPCPYRDMFSALSDEVRQKLCDTKISSLLR